MKKVSIVIPCRNEEKYIVQCINSFFEMDYPANHLEIIVVDGMSSDQTGNLVARLKEQFNNIKYILNPDIYTPHALNLGIKNASHDYVMIASAHSTYSKNYISELMHYFQLLKCDGIGGVLTTAVKNENKKSLSIIKVLSNKFGVGNSKFRTGTNKPEKVDTVPFGIYRKDIFNKVGLYNERLIRNQDMEFSKRLLAANKQIYLIPTAVSIYYARESFSELAKNNFGNGIWIPRTIYITKRISSLSIRHFIPLLFLSLLILTILFTLTFLQAYVLSIILLFTYLLLIIIISFHITDKRSNLFFVIWSFIVLHFSYGFGSLIGLFDIKKIFEK